MKYYIFRKLSTISNYGHALDINLPVGLTSTAALIRDHLLTVWVLNNSAGAVPVMLNLPGWAISNPSVRRTRWHEALPIEGVSDSINVTSINQVQTTIEPNSLYCFELTVRAGNVVPTARDDYFYVTRNRPVVAPVMANAMDADGDPLVLVSYSQGMRGRVVQSGSRLLTYTPEVNFTGMDRFRYSVTDGQGGTNTAWVYVAVYPAGIGPSWTNLVASGEAYIRGGVYATEDQDEAAGGGLVVKYHGSKLDFSRKAYFQFDLRDVFVPNAARAEFTVQFVSSNKQNVQLWALDQPYPSFSPAITWNNAQANELTGNDLLTNGMFTATRIGSVTNVPASGVAPQTFSLSGVRDLIHGGRLTLVLTGAPEDGIYTNHAGGLRLRLNRATLRIQALPPVPPETPRAPEITDIILQSDHAVRLNIQGDPGVLYRVQAATDLSGAQWVDVSTNTATADGTVVFTDPVPTQQAACFYRVIRP